jgi:hypothetical protein
MLLIVPSGPAESDAEKRIGPALKEMIREISNAPYFRSEDSASRAAALEESTASVNQMATIGSDWNCGNHRAQQAFHVFFKRDFRKVY